MTTINPFENFGPTAPAANDSSRSELAQEDFMTLMVAQFRNQDPFKPMENGDFLGQLAQFGTVSGIDELNSAFAGLQGSIHSEQALQAANLVGRSVLAETDSGYLPAGGSLDGAVELSAGASNLQVDVTDASGQLVRRIELGQQSAGMARFSWDGRNEAGDVVDGGRYSISARVMHGTETASVPALVQANIDSVTLGGEGQGLTLNLAGGGKLTLAQVRQIN